MTPLRFKLRDEDRSRLLHEGGVFDTQDNVYVCNDKLAFQKTPVTVESVQKNIYSIDGRFAEFLQSVTLHCYGEDDVLVDCIPLVETNVKDRFIVHWIKPLEDDE